MKILLATRHLLARGGTETWLECLYDELATSHEVSVYSVTENLIFPWMRAHSPSEGYDIALINHGPTFRDLRRSKISTRIFTAHGIRPDLEWPLPGAEAYASISEDVQEFIPYASRVIRNPIDGDRFRPASPPSSRLKRVLFMSNNEGWAKSVVGEACELLGVELRVAGGKVRTNDPVAAFNWADLVIGVGRTALEASACGRNVICLDHLGGEGMLTPESVYDVRTHNFSGRMYRKWYTPRSLVAEMKLYDPARSLRDYVLEEHSPRRIAGEYLSLAAGVSTCRKIGARVVRSGPDSVVTKRMTTLLDPFVREARKATAPDGRPGVLAGIWRDNVAPKGRKVPEQG